MRLMEYVPEATSCTTCDSFDIPQEERDQRVKFYPSLNDYYCVPCYQDETE